MPIAGIDQESGKDYIKKKEVKSKKKRTFKDVAICSRPSSKQEEFERHGELQSELI